MGKVFLVDCQILKLVLDWIGQKYEIEGVLRNFNFSV